MHMCDECRQDLTQVRPAANDCVSDFRTDTRMVSDAMRSIMIGKRRVT